MYTEPITCYNMPDYMKTVSSDNGSLCDVDAVLEPHLDIRLVMYVQGFSLAVSAKL